MPVIGLAQAVEEICSSASNESPPGDRRPFFFLVGAGMSSPSIPLSGEIVEHCRELVTQRSGRGDLDDRDPLTTYSSWFREAYPQPVQRQRYLRELIANKPLTSANLRLAHLLLEQTLANLVVTTNFDDQLSKSLTLFGKPHVLCDHPATSERIDPERDDIQIVHVHGTYWFYDCCNLSAEIAQRSAASSGVPGMSALLDSVLRRRSPVVIGYAGWENDVVMQALQRRLASRPAYNWYWFCHNRGQWEKLPEWLGSHPNVCFVEPPEADRLLQGISPGDNAPDGAGLTAFGPNEPSTQTNLLTAREIFDEFILRLGLSPPALTANPLAFFANELEQSLRGGTDLRPEDPYSITHVVDRVRHAQEREMGGAPDLALERIRDALRRSDLAAAIEETKRIDVDNLSAGQARDLTDMAWQLAQGLRPWSDERLTVTEVLIGSYDRASSAGAAAGPWFRARIADALVDKAVAHGLREEWGEAQAADEEVVALFASSTAPWHRKAVAEALVHKAWVLSRTGQSEGAVETYQQAIDTFGQAGDSDLLYRVARALVNKSWLLATLGRLEQAVEAADEVVRRFGSRTEGRFQRTVAQALLYKGFELRDLGDVPRAVQAFDELANRFGEDLRSDVGEVVGRGLVAKGLVVAPQGIDRAQGAFSRALDFLVFPEDEPSHLEASLHRIVALAGIHRLVEAERLLRARPRPDSNLAARLLTMLDQLANAPGADDELRAFVVRARGFLELS